MKCLVTYALKSSETIDSKICNSDYELGNFLKQLGVDDDYQLISVRRLDEVQFTTVE
jgi:hypothetical protein